jgi:hypothetical protein
MTGERGFGPGFQDARSRLYRAEYAAISLTIVSYLIWRTVYAGGVDWLQVALWAIFPDIVAFVPIGASSKRREWPSWGSNLYNLFHTILVWAAAFAATWALSGVVYWPLLGWLGHITVDRAVGYGLRAKPQPSEAAGGS